MTRTTRARGRTRADGDGERAPGLRARWRTWRRARPFWGGLLTVVAGAEICAIPLAPLEVMLHQGVAGIPSVLMGVFMVVMGLSVWFSPEHRSLAGVVTVLLAMAALVLSNLGGFFIGTIMGVVGGSICFAWQPRTRPADEEAPDGAPPAGTHHDGEPLTA
ncbi:hypothetical protein GCM10010406_07590 [Streptomyces thermolineatus]|uniref:Integral membrane protein n=1 Tax=Streptomyces thermolineatus TaxID=44033 RepID=A0ABN3KXP2_9ACTN